MTSTERNPVAQAANDARLRKAVQLIWSNSTRHSQRMLDVIYGPMAKQLRADVATILHGNPVGPSHKLAQYGNVRQQLLNHASIAGTCKADEDSKLEEAARDVLGEC